MLFPTVEFAIFFLLIFAISWSLQAFAQTRKLVLLIASYYFYAYWDWHFAFLLLECSLGNFVLAYWLDGLENPKHRKRAVLLGVAFNLGVLAYFKYCGFFLSSLQQMLTAFGWAREMKVWSVILPAGVSFFTFQGISYLVDVYQRKIPATRNPIDLLLYISFFPHLVAGPIVRAADFIPQLEKPVDAAKIRASYALMLIGLGLFKKVVIAHYLATNLVEPAFASPTEHGSVDLIFGIYGYAVQIYCDFSAYSDMAIGFAALLGYHFPKNFAQPYRSRSLQEFWRRWHISLSSWLRDYLYIGLGGSRGSRWQTYRNLFLTMLLGGLWHGAAWNFVLWGALHGSGLCAERWIVERHKKFLDRLSLSQKAFKWSPAIKIILVFHFVCFAWLFFAADSLTTATHYLSALTQINIAPRLLSPLVLGLLVLGFVGQFLPENLIERCEQRSQKIPFALQAVGLAVVVLLISALGPGGLAPFIYFRF